MAFDAVTYNEARQGKTTTLLSRSTVAGAHTLTTTIGGGCLSASVSSAARTRALSITGTGMLTALLLYINATGNARLELIVDGVAVYDQFHYFSAGSANALHILGVPVPTTLGGTTYPFSHIAEGQPVNFRATLEVWVTADAGGASLYWRARGTQ